MSENILDIRTEYIDDKIGKLYAQYSNTRYELRDALSTLIGNGEPRLASTFQFGQNSVSSHLPRFILLMTYGDGIYVARGHEGLSGSPHYELGKNLKIRMMRTADESIRQHVGNALREALRMRETQSMLSQCRLNSG
ncbi:MAG: hypothetical protein AABY00_02845 [Nanoarchaeota archaeon]